MTEIENNEVKANESIQAKHQTIEKKNNIQTISLVMNFVLLVGLIVLYVLFFQTKGTGTSKTVANNEPGSKTNFNIAFVRFDSIQANYEMAIQLRAELEQEYKDMQSKLRLRKSNLEKEAIEFQRKINKQLITQSDAEAKYRQLGMEEQNLMKLQEQYSEQYSEKEINLNLAFMDTITNFLERYNEDYNYTYILGYSQTSGILLANDSLDITDDVLNLLNDEYLEENPKIEEE